MEFLCVLIIYNKNTKYEQKMFNLHSKYLKDNKIKHYFVTYDEEQTENLKINENTISFKGKETYVPGIMLKTIEAINFILNVKKIKFNYLVRTNISTVINYDKLKNILKNKEYHYATFNTLTFHFRKNEIFRKQQNISTIKFA